MKKLLFSFAALCAVTFSSISEDAMYEPEYYTDPARVKTNTERLDKIKSELDKLVFYWEQNNEELEKMAAV